MGGLCDNRYGDNRYGLICGSLIRKDLYVDEFPLYEHSGPSRLLRLVFVFRVWSRCSLSNAGHQKTCSVRCPKEADCFADSFVFCPFMLCTYASLGYAPLSRDMAARKQTVCLQDGSMSRWWKRIKEIIVPLTFSKFRLFVFTLVCRLRHISRK